MRIAQKDDLRCAFSLSMRKKTPISNEKELLKALSVAMIRDNSIKLRFISWLSQLPPPSSSGSNGSGAN